MSVPEGSELQVIPPDVISLNTVLDALTKAGQLQRALKVLREGSVAPDQISYRTVLTGLAKAKDWDASVDLLAELLRSHAGAYGGGSASGDGGVAGIERGTYGIASLASQLPPVQRELKLIEALRERGLPVDGQCYLLAAYACKAAANATAAMALLDAHEAEPSSERQPQEAFYAAVIAACGAARAWDLQWEAFQRAQTAAWARGLRMSTVSVTNILHSAAKSGRVRQGEGPDPRPAQARISGGSDRRCYFWDRRTRPESTRVHRVRAADEARRGAVLCCARVLRNGRRLAVSNRPAR